MIESEGVKVLAESKGFSNLTTLNLSWNNISAEGAIALARFNSNTNCHIELNRNTSYIYWDRPIEIIITILSSVYKENNSIITHEIAKKLIFQLAREDERAYVKYFFRTS